jgi:hypothetical protein
MIARCETSATMRSGASPSRSASTGLRHPSTFEHLRKEMSVELEHGLHDLLTNVTHDDPLVTAKIALAHLNEFPDYYTRLQRMEQEARRDEQSAERD